MSTLVKISHRWKSHAAAHIFLERRYHLHQYLHTTPQVAGLLHISHLIPSCSFLWGMTIMSLYSGSHSSKFLTFYLRSTWSVPSINLNITCCSDCTIRTFHMANQQILSLKMRPSSSSSSLASSSLHFTVA